MRLFSLHFLLIWLTTTTFYAHDHLSSICSSIQGSLIPRVLKNLESGHSIKTMLYSHLGCDVNFTEGVSREQAFLVYRSLAEFLNKEEVKKVILKNVPLGEQQQLWQTIFQYYSACIAKLVELELYDELRDLLNLFLFRYDEIVSKEVRAAQVVFKEIEKHADQLITHFGFPASLFLDASAMVYACNGLLEWKKLREQESKNPSYLETLFYKIFKNKRQVRCQKIIAQKERYKNQINRLVKTFKHFATSPFHERKLQL